MTTDISTQITRPDSVETSLGTLEHKDGAPTRSTVDKVYDYLDLMHGVEGFVNAYAGASTSAIAKGFGVLARSNGVLAKLSIRNPG